MTDLFKPAPGTLEIRQGQPQERKDVEKVIRACGKHVRDYFDMRNTDDYWANGEVWVAWWGKVIVGFTVLHPLKREPVQSLYQVGVHPEWRGLNIATFLLREAMKAHPDQRTLRLVVSEENTGARAMYMKWGLVELGRKETRRNGFVLQFEGVPSWI